VVNPVPTFPSKFVNPFKNPLFFYRVRLNGYGLIREKPCGGNGQILPIPAISRKTSIKSLVEIRVIIDNGNG